MFKMGEIMIKKICLFMAAIILLGSCIGCSAPERVSSDSGGPVTLTVATPFSEKDGNRTNYVNAYKAYEAATGNTIIDMQTPSVDEAWKLSITQDSQSGNEPDVINFFIGADADELIKNDKVVPISEIRKEFPDYASNMKESLMPVSTYDGQQYAVSVYGYWEGLFVNKKVLADCGIEVPGVDYTWEQFLADCQTVKDNGYTPIACSLKQVPHYWFEYCVFNNGSVANHTKLPTDANDEIGESWSAGLEDMKTLYDRGFFPENTNEVDDDVTSHMILENKAAFLLDGSWKVGWIQENASKYGSSADDFTVTYVPSKGVRKATDAIGGFSMGYYITRKAWDDPEKRAACASFVSSMTTDEVSSAFGALTVTALKNGVIQSGEPLDMLAQSTLMMTKGCTAMVPATQDLLNPEARDVLFKDIPNITLGNVSVEQAMKDCLAVQMEQVD